ncbi:MAG: hypothetical protein RL463_51 [Bacteroidota bacterium]|jgi:hypothetical protein
MKKSDVYTNRKNSMNMKTLKISLVAASLLVAFMLIFSGCTKNGIDASAGGKVAVYLTDGPGEFDAVFIDIQKVEVKIDTSSAHKDNDDRCKDDDDRDDHQKRKDDYGEWVDIKFTPAVIDVLSLRNGVETKLGEANILTGTVRKIRITLGTQNSVVKNGVTSTLELRNETNNFLYVKLYDKHRERNANNSNVSVWVDFDVANSIYEKDGKFYLKPVLRPFNNKNFGEVEGKVLPLEAKAVVRITNGAGFNGVALPNREGKFKLRGLESGTYTVTVEGLAPYLDKVISNVVVTKGKETELGVITLTQ